MRKFGELFGFLARENVAQGAIPELYKVETDYFAHFEEDEGFGNLVSQD